MENEKYIRPTWDEYFMEVARSVAKRATCDRGRSGCVIARDNQILVTGYVGSPAGLPHCDEAGHLMKKMLHTDGSITQHCVRTVHAEQNAIISAARKDLIGGTMFIAGVNVKTKEIEPHSTSCMMCKRVVINSGIKEVIVRETNNEYTIYKVEDWINDDDSLNGKMGY